MISARAPRRRVVRAILGPLALGPGSIKALGLGRLARGIEPGPMIPTQAIIYYCYFFIRYFIIPASCSFLSVSNVSLLLFLLLLLSKN